MSTPPPSPYQPQGQPGQVPPPPPAYPQGGQPQGTQPQQQWGYGAPGSPQGRQGEAPKNFFAALFDWKFHTLITPKLVSWLYVITIGVAVLYWLILLFASFAADPAFGVLVLLLGPIGVLIFIAFVRLMFEFYFALVRMSDDIHRSQGVPRS